MKKLFSLAAMALVALMVTTFTSCSKDDDSKEEETPVTPINVKFLVCTLDNQTDFFDVTYTATFTSSDKKTTDKTFKLSEMKELTDASTLSKLYLYDSSVQMAKAFATTGGYVYKDGMVKAYTYDLGEYTRGSFALTNVKWTVKSNRPSDEEINVIEAATFYSPEYNYDFNNKTETKITEGIKNTDADLKTFADQCTSYTATFTY